MERKIRNDCVNMAKCGLTTLSKCRTQKADLKECEECRFVTRVSDRWKMIDRKPYKRCSRCGEFVPVDDFYVRKVKKNGKLYEYGMSECKMCVSGIRKNQYQKRKEKL